MYDFAKLTQYNETKASANTTLKTDHSKSKNIKGAVCKIVAKTGTAISFKLL